MPQQNLHIEELLPPAAPEFQVGFAANSAIVTSHLGEAQFIAQEMARQAGRRVYSMPLGSFQGWISVPRKTSYERAASEPNATLLAAAGAPGARAIYALTLQIRRLCKDLSSLSYFGRAEFADPSVQEYSAIPSVGRIQWGELPDALLDLESPPTTHNASWLGDPAQMLTPGDGDSPPMFTLQRRLETPLDCQWANRHHGVGALYDLALAGFWVGRLATLPQPEKTVAGLLESVSAENAATKISTPISLLAQPVLSDVWPLDEAVPNKNISSNDLASLEATLKSVVSLLLKN